MDEPGHSPGAALRQPAVGQESVTGWQSPVGCSPPEQAPTKPSQSHGDSAAAFFFASKQCQVRATLDVDI